MCPGLHEQTMLRLPQLISTLWGVIVRSVGQPDPYCKFLIYVFFLATTVNSFGINMQKENRVCVDWDGRYHKLDQKLSASKLLEKITFESDVSFEKDEFFYLTDLKVGNSIDSETIKKACFYLEQRRLFSRVCIVLKDFDQGIALHFILTGHKRLERVKIEGVLFGREKYRRMYGIEPGAKFTQRKHEYAVQNILRDLKKMGYLNAKISSKVYCDSKNKLVTVTLKIDCNDQFTILGADSLLQEPVQDSCGECAVLKGRVDSLLKGRLVSSKYSKKFLNKEVKFLKKYLAYNGYPFAQIKFDVLKNQLRKRVQLKFNIFLHQRQCYFFSGNSFFSKDELLDYVMFSGDPIWHLPLSLVVKDLTDLYKKHGFWQAAVEGVESENCYKFSINEGLRSVIRKVSIRGLDQFDSDFLVRKFFKKVLAKKYYDKKLLDKSLAEMTNWFVQSGFWDFHILSTEFKNLKLKSNLHELVIVVDEGMRRFLKSSLAINYEDLCLPFSKVNKDIPFRACYLQEQKNWLQDHFASQGYCNVSVAPQVKDEKGDVAVAWDVKFDEPVLLGKTVRRGNGKFLFNNLYRELPYKEGDVWQKQKLENAFFRIKNLDTFDSIRFFPASDIDLDGRKPVVLYLDSDNHLEFRTRLGFQKVSKNFAFKSGATYKAGGSALYKNISDRGDQLRFDADVTRFYRSIVAQYKIPIFIKMPLRLSTKVYTNKYDQPLFIGSKDKLYNVRQQGALIDIGYKGRVLNTGLNVGFEGIRVDNISKEYAAAIDFSDLLLSEQVPFMFIQPTMLVDYLNDKLNPRKGVLTLATLKGMFALGREQSYFVKLLLEQSVFLPMFNESTLAMRVRFGHIFTNNFNVIMPIERFYLGGANSLRSFEPDFAPPLGTTKFDGKDIFVPQGGKTMINASFEARLSLYKSFGVVLFQDLGILLKKNTNLGNSDLLTATGFGLRYMTPVGPLRFDIGWRPRRFVEDSNFAWFLTVGHTF